MTKRFELGEELRSRLLSGVDPDALERLLAEIPASNRTPILEFFLKQPRDTVAPLVYLPPEPGDLRFGDLRLQKLLDAALAPRNAERLEKLRNALASKREGGRILVKHIVLELHQELPVDADALLRLSQSEPDTLMLSADRFRRDVIEAALSELMVARALRISHPSLIIEAVIPVTAPQLDAIAEDAPWTNRLAEIMTLLEQQAFDTNEKGDAVRRLEIDLD